MAGFKSYWENPIPSKYFSFLFFPSLWSNYSEMISSGLQKCPTEI